jgi:hypothetical protein
MALVIDVASIKIIMSRTLINNRYINSYLTLFKALQGRKILMNFNFFTILKCETEIQKRREGYNFALVNI